MLSPASAQKAEFLIPCEFQSPNFSPLSRNLYSSQGEKGGCVGGGGGLYAGEGGEGLVSPSDNGFSYLTYDALSILNGSFPTSFAI